MTELMNIQQHSERVVITLKEITDILSKRHNDAMAIVEKMSQEASFGSVRKIRIVYNSRGQEIDTFGLTKRQAIAVGSRLDTAQLMKLIDRLDKPLTVVELLEQSTRALQFERDKNLKLLSDNKQKSETIKNVVHSNNTYTASQVAKDMENPISATLLNKMLNEAGVIFKQNGSWQLYSKYVGHNLTSIKETKPDRDGKTYPSLRWTALGKSWIYKNWTEIKQRVASDTLMEWELKITSNLPKVPMPNKEDRNF